MFIENKEQLKMYKIKCERENCMNQQDGLDLNYTSVII